MVMPQQQQMMQPPSHSTAPLPSSPEVKATIDKFVSYVVRSGPELENMVRIKQQNNPAFSWLFGGPDMDYYLWRQAHCARNFTGT
jgi:hypothetical protein